MNVRVILLSLLWLTGSAYAGYRLTERSFSWIDEPGFGLPTTPAVTSARAIDFGLAVPQELIDQAKDLSPSQMACLQAAAIKCLK